MNRALPLFFAVTVSWLPLPVSGQALEDIVEGDILTGWRGADGTHTAALRLRLAPGWKTYWRTPGDGGIPPRFDWSPSQNIASVDISWPTPGVFWQNGMRSIGYDEVVVLPIRFEAADPNAPIEIDGTVEIGVCEDVCVPVTLDLSGILTPEQTQKDGRIAAAIADRPLTADEAGVRGVDCAIEPSKDGLRLTATLDMPQLGSGEEIIVETADPALWVSDGQATRSSNGLRTTVEIVPPDMKPFPLERGSLAFTVLSDGPAVTVLGCF